MNELALFAGAGGGILGGHLLGWRTVCAVEFAAYPRRVLLARQRDGMLPRFPIWDDVRTFDGKPWRGKVDVVSGGFPCTDISAAGKGAGIEGEHSGLWGEMARIIGEVRPRFCSWRTHRSLWQEALLWSSVILPRWGMTRNGVVFQHPIAERPISEIDSGLWATPSATDGMRGGTLTENMSGQSLTQMVNMPERWPTPRSTDADRGGRGDLIQAIRENPNSHYRLWPTPRARENNDYQNVNRDKFGVSRGIALTLNGAVKMWATPTASTGGPEPEGTTGRKLTTQVGGQLNPTWVEWLMGWPLGWTDLKPLAMDRFREWQQQHGEF